MKSSLIRDYGSLALTIISMATGLAISYAAITSKIAVLDERTQALQAQVKQLQDNLMTAQRYLVDLEYASDDAARARNLKPVGEPAYVVDLDASPARKP